MLSTNWNVLHGADPLYNEYPDLPDSLRQQINEALLCYLSQPPSVCNAQLSQTIAGLIAAINALFEADYAIRFRRFSQQHYGFDSLMYQPMVDDYNFLTVANQPYRVAWKSVEAGRTDSVLLLTPFAQLPDSLHFETNSRTPVPHHEHACGTGCADNGAAILPVTGGEHNKTYQIYPVQTRRDSLGNPDRKYAGKLNVVSYNNKVTQVVIVPINGAGNLTDSDRAAIESQLNEIYRPAVASFTVEPLRPLQLDWFDTEAQNTLDSTNSAFYADYNTQMQRINQEINRLPGYDPQKYYLIVVQNAQGGIKGFMPRARNKGFIVAAGHGSLSDLGRTMAHELGHGAFRLRHPWEQFSGLAPGDTDNLMDYASGTRLHHYQWHIVHNPPPLAGLLDGDEEGELVGDGDQEENEGFQALPDAALLEQCYYTPSGALISFPGSDKIADRKFSAGGPIHIAPAGSLIKFKYKNKIYVAIYQKENTGNYYFIGYYDREQFHLLPEPKNIDQYPNGKLPAEAYIINPQEGCNVLVRRLDPQCRERFYTWHATSNKPYTGTCTDILVSAQAVEVPNEDHLFALVQGGPGRAFYDYVNAQQPQLSDSDCEYIRLIAVEIDRMGDILYESYNAIALSAMSKIDQYYYLNYNSWDYSLGVVFSNLRSYREQMESLKNKLNSVNEQDRAVLMVMNFRDKELESLPLDIRLHAIRVLSDGNITGGIREYLGLQIGSPETALIRLVRTVPKNQDTARQFLEALKSSGLIALLDRGFDDIEALYRDANYEQFAEAIIDLIKVAFPYDASVANCILDDENKAFLWGANQMTIPGGGQMNCTVNYQAQWNQDHTLQFRFKSVEVDYVSSLVGPDGTYGSWQCTETQQEEVLVDPYAWVMIYSSQEVKVDGVVIMPKGTCKAVPAFLFNYLVNERDNGVKRKLIHTGIEVAFLALGVGELSAACRVVRTIAMIDIGLQSTGIVVNLAEDDIVAEFGESGQNFVNKTRNLCAGGGLITLGASTANRLRLLFLLDNAVPEVAEFTYNNARRLSETVGPEQYERLHETANNYHRLHATADQLTLGFKQKFLSQGASEELANRLAEQVANLARRKNLGISNFPDAFASLLAQLGKQRSNTLLARCATWNTETLLAYIQDLPHIAAFFRNAPDATALRARLGAWEGLYTNPIMRTQTDALIESEYLLGKGFSTSDLNVFALHVDVIFSGKKNHLSTRVNNSSGFSLIHTDIQLKVILLRAKSLNLPDDELDDLLFISCRTSKQIFYHELMQQMDNWVNIIKPRGFPFLFHEFSQFQSFGISLKNKLNEIGISSIDVRVQGSSLRTPNAGDLDISIMISEYHFDELIKNGYNGRIRMNGNIINMSNMSHQDLINLSNDINLNPSIYNTIARNDFNYNFSNKTINASPFKEVPSGFRDVLIQTQLEFPNLGAEKIKNIQIQQYGAGFDLKPFLNM